MERLPDRNPEEEKRVASTDPVEKEKQKKKEKLRSNFSTYGLLIVVVCVLFLLMADEPIPFEDIQIDEIRVTEDGEGLLLIGTVSDEAGRYCKSQVNFDEASGSVEVSIRQYQVTTFLGTKEFIIPIEEDPNAVKSIWLLYDDGSGRTERKQLEYGEVS